MTDVELVRALKNMSIETGGIICLGCGHEHDCGVHGCAVLRKAAKRILQAEGKSAEWISAEEKLPPEGEEVLVCTKSKNGVRNIDKGYWIIDRFIHRGNAKVTHWMPLPEPPKGE